MASLMIHADITSMKYEFNLIIIALALYMNAAKKKNRVMLITNLVNGSDLRNLIFGAQQKVC